MQQTASLMGVVTLMSADTTFDDATRTVSRARSGLYAALKGLASAVARPATKLTSAQRIDLELDMLDTLRRRSLYWIATVMSASLIVLCYGTQAATRGPGIVAHWFGPGAITTPVWCAMLWLLLCPYVLLARRTARLSANALNPVRRLHCEWSAWVVVVMLWWLLGHWTLASSPEPIRHFEFGQRPFVFYTLILCAAAITMLATSRTTITLGIVGGYIIPFTLFIGPGWKLPFSYIQVIGFAVIFVVLGWLIGTDQRRLRARSILIAAEQERANRFIASISHDLRQPITTLRMRLRTMSGRAPADMLPDLHVLNNQTETLIAMVEATSDLARLEAGTWRLQPRETPLPFVLDRIRIEQFGDSGDGVHLSVEPIQVIVRTDPAALDRMLRNLVANAIRYSRRQAGGEPSFVRVWCETDGPIVRIHVADNGIGIPAARLDDIFREYVQLDNPERDGSKGFGLGLSIVKGLADRLGHGISVTSVIGEGSIFTIAVEKLGRIPPELMPVRQPDCASPDLTGMVVAIVEDEDGPRQELRSLLIAWGAFVVDGRTSDEVIGKLDDDLLPDKPHFIICDYRLRHHRTGIEAVRDLRAAIGGQTEAAIWTAETSPDILRDIAARGLSHFAKPPDEQELLTLLHRHRPVPAPT